MSQVQELIEKSRKAQKAFEFATQKEVDMAARAVCKIVFDNAEFLGEMAVKETGMGNKKDKIAKCRNKSALIWESLKNKKTAGVIARREDIHILEIAKPMGVVAAIIPSTNPVVTPMGNAAAALKTRNSIIFAPHPRAVECTKFLVKLFQKELEKLNLPKELILTLEEVSIEGSSQLMSLADVIVATGGPSMVKAAYSSGKPSLGVGQGNVQCIIDRDVDLEDAIKKVILGRSFDNGLICLGEQTVFVPEERLEDTISLIEKNGGYYVNNPEDVDRLKKCLFSKEGIINREVVGVSAYQVAKLVGLKVSEDTKVIVASATAIGKGDNLCREKLCPVMNVMTYQNFKEGVGKMVENLELEGKGHSISIHSNNQEHIEYAAIQCSVSRVIVNQPAGTTGGGSPTNGFIPTTTLGCGSWGNNSFSGNFNYEHLMNITRVGYPYKESYLPNPELAWE